MSVFNFSCLQNVSQDSVTDFGWTMDFPDDPYNFDLVLIGYVISVTILLFFVTGVPWNVFVICIILKMKLYSNPTILLLLNLAITNLLLCLLVMPLNIITGFSGEYLFGNTDAVRCHVCQTGIFLIILPWVSIHTLSLLSVDRFIYLKKLFKTESVLITPRRMLVAVVMIWIFCTVISLPPLFGFGEIKFSFTIATCTPYFVGSTHIAPNYFYILSMCAEISVPLIVLVIMYIWILCIVRKNIVDQRALKKIGTHTEDKSHSVQLRLVRVFGAIFTANLLTWIPLLALGIAGAILGPGHIPTPLYTISYLAFLAETVIHPILEACLIREVRVIISGYLGFCKKKLCWCHSKKSDPDANVYRLFPVANREITSNMLAVQ